MTFATDVTAIYAGRNGGKTYLSRKMVSAARLPRVVYIDPVASEGVSTPREVLAALESGAPVVVLRSADRRECLATVLAVYKHSTKAQPVYLVCDEAPLYLDRATDSLKKIMFQGRHRGMGMMILAQRPTAVAAAIRSQAVATYWGRLTDHNDTALAAQAIGPARARSLSTAPTGHFIRHPDNQEDQKSWQNAPSKSAARSAKPLPAPRTVASKKAAGNERKPLSAGARRAG